MKKTKSAGSAVPGKANPGVDAFIKGLDKWQAEMKELRKIVRECPVTEEMKWGQPCYTFEGNNIVIIHGFKEYCAVLFVKGALLKDSKGVLIRQTENVQEARQIRFTGLKEIVKLKGTIKAYIKEAIAAEKAGLKVPHKKTSDFKVPGEFKEKLDSVPGLKVAFENLTPGRQRAYLFYFSQAKQSKTREDRVEKYMDKILDGKGLDD